MGVRALFRGLVRCVNIILPARCLGCGDPVVTVGLEAGALCPECFQQVDFIVGDLCLRCGLPLLETGRGNPMLCGACIRVPPVFGQARAAFVYDGIGRELILRFKHADRTDAAPNLARWMAGAGHDLLKQADILVPVPLHWRRLFVRRYNQAALLGRALERVTGVPHDPMALVRVQATVSQGKMNRKGRARNVRRAFDVCRKDVIAGRRVVLIDDVLTTGMTANACADALFRAEARSVDILTLARVPLRC